MTDMEDLFKCAGWQAINRIGAFTNMHNIFQQNHLELKDLLIRIQNDLQLSKETIQLTWAHLEQRVFNYLSSAYARKMMDFYKEKKIYLQYNEKINIIFKEDPLSQFIKKLRNYQIHNKITPMTFSYTTDSMSVVFLSRDLLENKNDWNEKAKEFIKKSRSEVGLLNVISEYTNKIDTFYTWLYEELGKYHQKDFKQKNNIERRLGLPVDELENTFNNLVS